MAALAVAKLAGAPGERIDAADIAISHIAIDWMSCIRYADRAGGPSGIPRRALKRCGDQPTTSLAIAFGCSSAGQFTRHYKLMFAEPPSETLKLHGGGPGSL